MMWQRLCQLLEDTARCRILVVGDFMLDRYVYGDAERISPEAPVPILRVVRQEAALGGSGSVVADVAALEAQVSCVGVIGDDADGRVIEDLLRKAGADPSGLLRISGRPTTRKTRLVGLAQHRHRQQLIRVDEENTDPVGEPHCGQLLATVERELARCQVVCIEDYNKGVVTNELSQAVIRLAKARGVPVLVDPANISDYSRYRGATAITPNRSETEKACGRRLRSIEAVRAAAREIHAACRCDYTCVTLDAEGAALIGPDGACEHVPTIARDVYDVTGAGDEVLAALAVALAAGGTMTEALALANVAGGLEVEKFGCVPIKREEVIGEILLQHAKDAGKIRTLDRLLPELARRRSKHEKIAFTNGCFDILHAGHVANFAFCREHADVLVVGLNSDASVRRLGKGDGRPVVEEKDRAEVLQALADVDYVVIFDDDTPLALIQAIKPDVLLKGADWAGKTVVGQDVVEAHGGQVLLVPLVEGRSTTGIIERIRGETR